MEEAYEDLPEEVEADPVRESYLALFEKDRARSKAAKRRALRNREAP
jgi:hypothetical protein